MDYKQFVKVKETSGSSGRIWRVYLSVGVQSFQVGYDFEESYGETREHVDRFASMLVKALTNMQDVKG